jgi:hypothetical protein
VRRLEGHAATVTAVKLNPENRLQVSNRPFCARRVAHFFQHVPQMPTQPNPTQPTTQQPNQAPPPSIEPAQTQIPTLSPPSSHLPHHPNPSVTCD